MNYCLLKRLTSALFAARLIPATIAVVLACLATAASAQPAPAQPTANLFESKVRPLLLASCVGCHGKESPGGGLRLDAAVSLDKAHELIKRVKGEGGKPRMPLGSSLSPDKIAYLEQWVAAGAKWPAGTAQAANAISAKAKSHWAFLPITHPAAPNPKASAWVRNPIDAFILAKLEKKGLRPSPTASRRELIRRLTFDLIGLPPTQAEVTAFENDRSPNAYDQLVDRLLSSPHYGEKWGRRWLDLVRYAETNSYERDNPKPNVYKYRDYVIRSFNEDKPYDRFVREQIAGDEMPDASADDIIATGYYRLGIWDDEPADMKQAEFDDLDDLVVTTGQTFLGLTIDCARCHDHKFDPIPQSDYYRLAAIFCNINRFKNGGPTDEATVFTNAADKAEYGKKIADLEAKKAVSTAKLAEIEAAYKKKRDNLLKPADLADLTYKYYEGPFESLPDFNAQAPVKNGTLNQTFIDLKQRRRDVNFGFVFEGELNVPAAGDYTFYLDSDDGSRLIVAGKRLTYKPGGGGQGNEQHGVIHLPAGRSHFRIDYFQAGGPFGLNFAWSGPGFGRRPLSALSSCSELGLPTLIQAELAQVVGKESAGIYTRLAADKAELYKLNVPELKALCVTEAGPTAPNMFIMKRGNPNTPGDKVQPRFPTCLGGGDAIVTSPTPGAKTTGRRTLLANWLVSPSNPLPARVIVNRIWQGHFGRGIVRTPSDFGLQGALPTHPQLLDWLATEFVKDGWSFKKLHRLILTSNTYKQSSHASAPGLTKDPGNDLFWRFDMRRLDAEEIRDSLLAVSGSLNPQMYGEPIYPEIPKEILAAESRPGADWYTEKMTPQDLNRRSIYIHVKRSMLYPLLSSFDMADTDRTSAVRFASTQPTQALSMLNSPFALQQAHALAALIRAQKPADDKAFIGSVFSQVLQRTPTAAEMSECVSLLARLEGRGAAAERAQEYICLMVLNLDEFMYID